MDRVQRSGLITLVLLLLVAVAGLVLGPRRPGPEEQSPAGAVVDSDLATTLAGPAQRRFTVSAPSFDLEPVSHPIRGGPGRDVNAPVELPATGLRAEIPLDPAGAGNGGWSARDSGTRTGGGQVVRVREGESLSSISKRVTGSSRYAEQIRVFNGIEDPRSLRIGQAIRIPAGLLPGQGAAPASAEQSLRIAGAAPRASSLATYTVRHGDTPGEISRRLYGSAKYWRKLLEANGVRDPKRLRVGQELIVPELQ